MHATQRIMMSFAALLTLLTVFSAAMPAQALIIVSDERIMPPHPIPHPPHIRPIVRPYPYCPLETLEHQVQVTIKDQVAITAINEVVYNQSPHRLEGTFLMPLPKDADIDEFTMSINGKQVAAELLPADKAKQIYEEIVRSMRDPALLEYCDRQLVKVRIFPIEPNEKKRITLQYKQVLERDTDLVSYTYPLDTQKFSAKPLKNVAVKVTIESQDVIKSIYSPSHEVGITREGDHKATIGFEQSNVRPDQDFKLLYGVQPSNERIGVSMLTYDDPHDGEDAGFFMLLASPGAIGAKDEIIEKDVIFVLDTSGSMAGEKLEQAQGALRFCVENLNEGDRFDIIRFSTEAESLFGKLTKAEKQQKVASREFIEGFKAVGGTAINEALALALTTLKEGGEDGRPRTVIFLTDGRPTIGVTDSDAILKNVVNSTGEKTMRVFCFGLGHDVNTHLLDKITDKTKSFSQYVLPKEDIEVKVSNFYAKVSTPVLTDVELKIHGNVKISRMYPRPLPDLFKGDQLVVFGRYDGKEEVTLTLTGKVGKNQEVYERTVNFSNAKLDQAYVAQFWAARRVGHLLDEIALNGEKQELKDEVVRLARQYGIVTPYTSYLIVEDERQNTPAARRAFREQDEALGEFLGGFADGGQDGAGRPQYAPSADAQAASGEKGVARARSNYRLKNAERAGAVQEANDDALYAYGETGKAIPQQNVRQVRGKTFYQNGEQWVDGNVPRVDDDKIERITFNSDEYYDLLAKHPEAAQWLSVGRNVQFELNGQIYEVVDES